MQTQFRALDPGIDDGAVVVHEPLLQEVVLERVETPQRFLVELLAFVGGLGLVEKFLAGGCTALESEIRFGVVVRAGDIPGEGRDCRHAGQATSVPRRMWPGATS